jgi:hypothetical protein
VLTIISLLLGERVLLRGGIFSRTDRKVASELFFRQRGNGESVSSRYEYYLR